MTRALQHAARRAAEAEACHPPDPLTPADRYAELYTQVQTARVFADSKTFVDSVPRRAPQAIVDAYRRECQHAGFDLPAFVRANFDVATPPSSDYVSDPGQSLVEHIDSLWPVLTRHPHAHPPHSTLLPLPQPYVIPGGRFAELYYWDSYFTMLGLDASGRSELLHAMTDNFAYLIDTYGHVPNGNRSYYLSRSQPPLFAFMVELCEGSGGTAQTDYLPQLQREHAYWMDGAESLAPGEAHRRVLRLADGSVLNRYWDDRDTPREEAYSEDLSTAAASGRPPNEVYRDLRAAAESGWDFSTRWLSEDPADVARVASGGLATICTTAIAPVDLNALLCKLERKIGELSRALDDNATAEHFERLADVRRDAMTRWMWDAAQGAFFDLDWRAGRRRQCLTAATLAPLFADVTTQAQADAVARTVEQRLLVHGGVSTTECESDQQWDRPNGWPPLQWMAMNGLHRHGHTELACTIAHRWLDTVSEVYKREAKLVEKYALRAADHEQTVGGDGGEYPLQDGFGWTNGVTRCVLQGHPEHAAHQAVAGSNDGAPVAAPRTP